MSDLSAFSTAFVVRGSDDAHGPLLRRAMISRTSLGCFALVLIALVGVSGCERDLTGLDPAPFPNDPLVFGDAPGPGLDWFFTFDTSIQDPFPFQFEDEETFRGDGAVRIEVPGPGQFVGGVFITSVPRDLSGYNALTFWARASANITMNEVGFGLDFDQNSYRTAVTGGVPLTTGWRKVTVPIPDPAKLTLESGMFWMAEGTETGGPYNIWVDEIQWESISTFANYRPTIESREIRGEVGGTLEGLDGTLTVDVAGSDVTVGAAPAYFEFTSSDPSVVAVTPAGVEYVGSGTATLTATLAGRPAEGQIVVTVSGPPQTPAPTPNQPADEVISLYSDAYDDVTVDTWSAVWDNADVEDVVIAGDNVKKYTNLTFAGIEFTSAPIDATNKGFIHLDVYAAQPSLTLKFVDFGPDGVFGNDDSEAIITFDASSITPNAWSSLDIPFSMLGGLAERAHLAQVVVEGTSPTLYIDNFYIYGTPGSTGPQEPEAAAPTPTQAAGSVISMFSNAYNDVVVDTWSAVWDQATVEDVVIAGDDMKKYTGLTFAGIEAVSQPIDATGMTHFRMDFWTPDDMSGDAFFQVRLVDFGADGAFDGGDDTAANLVINASSTPPIASGQWVSIDVPLTAFAGMNTGAIAQIVIEGTPSTIFIDNVYFYNAN